MSASAAATVVSAAQKASSFANNTVETARFDVLKEPLGFIKIVQFFMALLAFAIAVNGASSLQFTVNCAPQPNQGTTISSSPGFSTITASFSYPYNLNDAKFEQRDQCVSSSTPKRLDRAVITTESNNIVSSAQFFVFVGVTSFIYSIAFFVVYVFFRHKYNNIVFLPLGDFAFTCVWAFFWFVASVAWAKAITDIQNFTDPDAITKSLTNACGQGGCNTRSSPTYANIIVSCILGFGNWLLWSGDVWFVLKETSWYKTRQQLRQQQQNQTNNPISTNDINITAHYNPNNRI